MSSALDRLLRQFSLQASVFYTGNICGPHLFEQDEVRGHLHLVKRGPVQLLEAGKPTMLIEQPTLVFLPRPKAHRLLADAKDGADVVCATIVLGGGRNLVSDSLPDTVLIELQRMPGIEDVLGLMFDEALHKRSGKQAVLDRLCEILMIRMLRHSLELGIVVGGTLAGLADAKLVKALEAVHEQPDISWNLSSMAERAGMSRSRFAERFRGVVGVTPAEYLASLRMTLAQRLLARGMPVKNVALEVGYGSSSTLHRAFVRIQGMSPSDWLRAQAAS